MTFFFLPNYNNNDYNKIDNTTGFFMFNFIYPFFCNEYVLDQNLNTKLI